MSGYTEVFAWGGDHHGQLGLASRQPGKTYNIPRYCSFNVFIKELACGEEHAAFITLNGEVYTMGNNAEGRLGIGNRSIKQCASPCLVETLSAYRAVSISCGWGHTAAVNDSGDLFTWGAGEHGALGLNSTETQWVPARVNLPLELSASNVSCGARHSAVIAQTRTGMKELWTCGAGEAGQLGTGRREKELQFVRVSFADTVKQVSCGVFHTGFITPTGRVYMMGGNSFGQLGVGTKKSSSLPMRVTALDSRPIVKVSCGHHSAAVSERGELFLWGTGSFGEYLIPQMTTNIGIKIADVCVGGSFGAAIDVNNGLWAWGSNTNGELGVGDYEPRLTPFSVSALQGKRIRTVACGSSFCIALGQDIGLGDPLPSAKKRSIQVSENTSTPARPTHVRSGTAYEAASPLRPRNLHTPDASIERETLKGYYTEVKGELNRLKETAGGVNDLRRALEEANERLEETKRRLDKETSRGRRLEEDLLEERHRRDIDLGDIQTKENELSAQKTFTEKLARERTEFEHLFMDRDNQMRALQADMEHLAAELAEKEKAIRNREKELGMMRTVHEQVSDEKEGLSGHVEELQREQRALTEALGRKETELNGLRTSLDREKRAYEDLVTSSKREMSDLHFHLDSVTEEKRSLESEFAAVQRDFEIAQQERISCKQELRDLLTTKESLLSDLKSHRDKLAYKETELINMRRDLDLISRERQADANRMNQLQDLLAGREGEVEALKGDLEQAIRERVLISEEVSRVDADAKSLKQEKEKLEIALEQQVRTSALYRNSLDETQRKHDFDWKRKEETQMQEVTKLRDTYENRISVLNTQLAASEDQCARVKKDYEDAILRVRRTEEAANLHKDRTEIEIKRKDEERSRLSENYESRLSIALRDLSELKETRIRLERELEDSALNYKSLEEKLRIEALHWQDDMQRQGEEHTRTINNTTNSFESRLMAANKQISDEQSARRLLNKDLESALLQVKRLEESLKATQEQAKSDLKRTESDAKSALAQTHDSHDAKMTALTRQLHDEKDTNMALERELSSLTQAKRRLEENLETQQRKGEDFTKEIADLKQIIASKDAEIHSDLEDIEAGKARERDLSLLRDELRQELERQKGLIARLKAEIAEKEAALAESDGQISASRQENAQLHAAVDELKYEIEALGKQNHDNLSALDKMHEVNDDLNEKYQEALRDVHDFQVQVTELEAKNRELFSTFEKELSNRAREFRERTLGVLGTPSPLRPTQTASPTTHKHVSIHSSASKSPLTTATSVSKQLDRFREESPDRRAQLGLRTEAETSYQQRLSRAASRLADTLGYTSPITYMRVSSPMRQSMSRFTAKSPVDVGRGSSVRQSRSVMEAMDVQRIEEGSEEQFTDS